MYYLSDQQIEYILNDIRRNGVEMEDLQLNLLDHICCIIEQNLEEILVHWTDFAATSGPAGRAMDHSGLRDHAFAMLKDMVSDLRTPQSAD